MTDVSAYMPPRIYNLRSRVAVANSIVPSLISPPRTAGDEENDHREPRLRELVLLPSENKRGGYTLGVWVLSC